MRFHAIAISATLALLVGTGLWAFAFSSIWQFWNVAAQLTLYRGGAVADVYFAQTTADGATKLTIGAAVLLTGVLALRGLRRAQRRLAE